MATIGNITIDLIIKTRFSLWAAIKLRIAGKYFSEKLIKIITMEDKDDNTGNEEEID